MKQIIIEKQKIKNNISIARERAGGVPLCGVLQNDAYGLGLIPVAKVMRDEGIRRFAVSEPSDAGRMRKEGFTDEEILLMRSTADPAEIEMLLDFNVIATIGSQEAAMALSGIAERRSTVAEAHIKVDTGFGRYGFLPSETDKIVSVIQYMQSIAVSGVYTHLDSGASMRDVTAQLGRFDGVLDQLRGRGLETGTVHAVGSTALFRFRELPLYSMVRVGAALGGRIPGKHGLQRAGLVAAQISEVRWIPEGNPVSRGRKQKKPVRVGVVPLGFADGFGLIRPAQSRLQYLQRFLYPPEENRVIRTGSGERLRLMGVPGQDYLVVDLTKSDAAVGTTVYADVNPLFASGLQKKYL